MRRDASVRLRDGRTLRYCEWGAARGAPVFHFHGIPGSRLEVYGGEAAYAAMDARLVTVDRPGIGRSDRSPGRRLLDWPDDVAALADELGIERFAVMGHSAGAAYALACAYALSGRVSRAAVVGAVPPLDRPEELARLGTARYWRLGARRPRRLAATYAAWASAMRLVPPLGRRMFLRGAAAPDRAIFDRPDVRRRFRTSVVEATRGGTRGLVEDMRVLMQPWGFHAKHIHVETLLWHGHADHHVPSSAARAYAETMPRCTPTFVEGEGHFSLVERHAPAIVAALIGKGDEG